MNMDSQETSKTDNLPVICVQLIDERQQNDSLHLLQHNRRSILDGFAEAIEVDGRWFLAKDIAQLF